MRTIDHRDRGDQRSDVKEAEPETWRATAHLKRGTRNRVYSGGKAVGVSTLG